MMQSPGMSSYRTPQSMESDISSTEASGLEGLKISIRSGEEEARRCFPLGSPKKPLHLKKKTTLSGLTWPPLLQKSFKFKR